jgi:succinate dehydrogenase hydrophobic anchor subunit
MESPNLIVCPCCGAKAQVDLGVEPCESCGAFSVGPPLARPERELPAYGLTSAVAAGGALIALVFAAATALALFEIKPFSLRFWNVAAAAETASWRLKFVLLPISVAAFVAGARALMRVSRDPSRHVGVRFALGGFATAALVATMMLTLIGITVPERLRQREAAIEAAKNVEAYDAIRALLEYQQQFGTLPTSAEDLTKKLPDPDGSIARAAAMLAPGFARYEPESTIASLPASAKARGRRSTSVTIRPVSLRTGADDAQPQGESLAFTNYTLRLAGADKKLGTEDDLYVRDGMIVPAPPAPTTTSRAPAAKRVP